MFYISNFYYAMSKGQLNRKKDDSYLLINVLLYKLNKYQQECVPDESWISYQHFSSKEYFE